MVSLLIHINFFGLQELSVFVNGLNYLTFLSSVSVTEIHVNDLNILSNIYVLKVMVCNNYEILIL